MTTRTPPSIRGDIGHGVRTRLTIGLTDRLHRATVTPGIMARVESARVVGVTGMVMAAMAIAESMPSRAVTRRTMVPEREWDMPIAAHEVAPDTLMVIGRRPARA